MMLYDVIKKFDMETYSYAGDLCHVLCRHLEQTSKQNIYLGMNFPTETGQNRVNKATHSKMHARKDSTIPGHDPCLKSPLRAVFFPRGYLAPRTTFEDEHYRELKHFEIL